jgi:hypothetical protein
MTDTSFPRADEPEAGVAVGYLGDGTSGRTNVLHLPVRGTGDGGAVTTVRDVDALWRAFVAGRVVAPESVARMCARVSRPAQHSLDAGLGVWLDRGTSGLVIEGADAGVSFRSRHDPDPGTTVTVVSNTSTGAWPLARLLDAPVPG